MCPLKEGRCAPVGTSGLEKFPPHQIPPPWSPSGRGSLRTPEQSAPSVQLLLACRRLLAAGPSAPGWGCSFPSSLASWPPPSTAASSWELLSWSPHLLTRPKGCLSPPLTVWEPRMERGGGGQAGGGHRIGTVGLSSAVLGRTQERLQVLGSPLPQLWGSSLLPWLWGGEELVCVGQAPRAVPPTGSLALSSESEPPGTRRVICCLAVEAAV